MLYRVARGVAKQHEAPSPDPASLPCFRSGRRRTDHGAHVGAETHHPGLEFRYRKDCCPRLAEQQPPFPVKILSIRSSVACLLTLSKSARHVCKPSTPGDRATGGSASGACPNPQRRQAGDPSRRTNKESSTIGSVRQPKDRAREAEKQPATCRACDFASR